MKNQNKNKRVAIVNDSQEQEKIISDLNILLSDDKAKVLDVNRINPKNDYTIELFKNNKPLQKYTLSKKL